MTNEYLRAIERHRDRIPPGFDEWVRAQHIESEVGPHVYTVATWTRHCSPPDATSPQKALACTDLAVCFFYLDDYQGEDYRSLFDEYESNLDRVGGPAASKRPISEAHSTLLKQLQDLGHPMAWYIEQERKLLDEYRLRNDVSRGIASIDYERYRSSRLVTIYVYQWVELWQLLAGFPIAESERATAAYQDSVRLTSTYFYLGNELYSLERDVERGDPNLVPLLAREEGIDLDEAAARIAAERDEVAQQFEDAVGQLMAGSDTMRRCGALLRQCVDSATAARHDNPERYRQPDSPS